MSAVSGLGLPAATGGRSTERTDQLAGDQLAGRPLSAGVTRLGIVSFGEWVKFEGADSLTRGLGLVEKQSRP